MQVSAAPRRIDAIEKTDGEVTMLVGGSELNRLCIFMETSALRFTRKETAKRFIFPACDFHGCWEEDPGAPAYGSILPDSKWKAFVDAPLRDEDTNLASPAAMEVKPSCSQILCGNL